MTRFAESLFKISTQALSLSAKDAKKFRSCPLRFASFAFFADCF